MAEGMPLKLEGELQCGETEGNIYNITSTWGCCVDERRGDRKILMKIGRDCQVDLQ